MKLLLSFFFSGILAVSLSAQQPVAESVSMTSFNAIARNKQVLLTWSPETLDVKSYEMERSKNGTDYVPFGKRQGANVVTDFMETDFTPYEGLSYYRLKLENADGSISYSNAVPVKYDANGNPTSPIPPSATGSLDNALDSSVLVVLLSNSGDEYYSKIKISSAGDPVECSNADPNLTLGTYTIIACSEQELYSKQLLVK